MTADGVEALYPFLYDQPGAELTDAVASARAKAAEIAELRQSVVQYEGERIEACAAAMASAFAAGGRLLTFGNGGSSTDAASVARLFAPALDLAADPAVLTALANDVGFDLVFSRQIDAWGRAGDVALGLSTSGGSENVVRGLEAASRRGMLTVALAGYDGGRLAANGGVDFLFVIPSSSVHRIQEAQTTVYHLLWQLVQQAA